MSRWILLFLSVVMSAILAGCGGSTKNAQNPPAPASSSVSIAFKSAPASSVNLASSTSITAVVSNDPSHAGVDWALLCQSSISCGTLTPLHTASGAAATYKPPSTLSGNEQSVTIEAFATADHDENVLTTITVTAFASNLKGTYVFETKGQDANGNSGNGGPLQLVGVVVLDGNGGITTGEQTLNGPLVSASNSAGPILSVSDTITGGSYYIGPDGRGTLTLNTADQSIGQLGIENFSLVALSSGHALIATFDNPNLQSSAETSSGAMDLQTSTAAPTKGYAFTVSGIDNSGSSNPMAMGGVLNIDSPNTISGTGSIADQYNPNAAILSLSATVSGSLTNPDALGSLKFNLTSAFAASLQFTGYIVDSTHIKLIESDNNAGTGFGSTVGVAIGQGAATGAFTANSAFAGNYVINILGENSGSGPSQLASVGQLIADSSGNLSGYDDEVLTGGSTPVGISDSFTGTYTLDATGTGRIDSTTTFTTPVNGAGPELIFYLTGNGNPPLVLDADDNASSLGLGYVGSGLAYPQAAPPFSFSGEYGLEFTESINGFENDATGQVAANGTAGTLTGFIDTTLGASGFSPQPDTQFSGTYASISATGQFSGTLNNAFFPTNANNENEIAVDFYSVNPNQIFFIETDTPTTGELTIGQFATRTRVCTGCP